MYKEVLIYNMKKSHEIKINNIFHVSIIILISFPTPFTTFQD